MSAEKGNVPCFRLFPESLSVPLPLMECIQPGSARYQTHTMVQQLQCLVDLNASSRCSQSSSRLPVSLLQSAGCRTMG